MSYLHGIILVLAVHSTASLNTSSVLFQEVFAYHNETAFKAEFASQVVKKIYNSFRQWYFTILFCEFTYSENRILKYTESMDYGYPVLLLDSCNSKNSTRVKPRLNKHGACTYIISSDELSYDVKESAFEALLRTGVFKPRSPVIYVINTPVKVDAYFYYEMKKHFQRLFNMKVSNTILILWSDKLRMYGYLYFLKELREITDIEDASQFLRTQYDNLHGHTLRLSVFKKIFLNNIKGPVKCDSLLAQTVMKFMNASCLPLEPRDGSTVGDLLENGTATGVTGDLIEGYTDLELSSRILKNSYYGYIDTTYPLFQDALCFIIKTAGTQAAFTTTIQLISRPLLLLCTFTVVFFITAAYLSRKIEMNILKIDDKRTTSSVMMEIIKCFLRQTISIKFFGPVFRCVVILIIIYSLIIGCVIDGLITSAITYPRSKPDINNLTVLMKETNLTLGIHNRHLNIIIPSLTENYYNIVKNRIEVVNDAKIRYIIEHRDFRYAVLLRKMDALYVIRNPANTENGQHLFHLVSECPLPCFIVFGLQYGSPYLNRINYLLNHLNQAGILQYWSETEELSLDKKLFFGTNNKENKPLTIEILKEVFFVWIIGITFCFIVLICEIFWHNFGRVVHVL